MQLSTGQGMIMALASQWTGTQTFTWLAAAMSPRWMIVETDWRGRGGIRSRIRVNVGDVPTQ